jgi:hypothetical protein
VNLDWHGGHPGFPNFGLQAFTSKLAKGKVASLSGAQYDARCFQISMLYFAVQFGNHFDYYLASQCWPRS